MNYINIRLISDIEIYEVYRSGKKRFKISISMNNGNDYNIEILFETKSEAHSYLLKKGFIDKLINIQN